MRKINKILITLVLFILISPVCHAQYTDKQILDWYNNEIKKLKSASVLADYMYDRIKYYQKFDTWYERHYIFEYMYEALQRKDKNDN